MFLFSNLNATTLLARAIVLMTAIPVHEAAHAYVAERLGDRTAFYHHRISLNPLDHMDPIGTLMILLFGIGFARPVPVDSSSFRNRRTGLMLTSLAGPISNLLLALLSLMLYKILFVAYALTGFRLLYGAARVFAIMTSTNLSLAVFNLLPVPPLDGWHAVQPFLPARWTWQIGQYEQQIIWVVLVLVWLGVFDWPLRLCTNALYSLLDSMTFFLDPLLRVVS